MTRDTQHWQEVARRLAYQLAEHRLGVHDHERRLEFVDLIIDQCLKRIEAGHEEPLELMATGRIDRLREIAGE